jgi:hypothetical protein
MKVIVVFEYENIKDPNSKEATAIVEDITESCDALAGSFNATTCYIDDCIESAFDYVNELKKEGAK